MGNLALKSINKLYNNLYRKKGNIVDFVVFISTIGQV